MEITKNTLKIKRVGVRDDFLQLKHYCPRISHCFLQEAIPLASLIFHLRDHHRADQIELNRFLQDIYQEEYVVPKK